MASVGQGAADGLMSGFRMAMDIQANRRANDRDQRLEERQGRMDERQAGLDRRVQADHDRNVQRQKDADELAVIEMEDKDITAQGNVYNVNRPKDPTVLAAFANRAQANDEKKAAWRARKSGGLNPAANAQRSSAEDQAVLAGTAPPEVMLRHVERLSGLPIDDFMDVDGNGSALHRASAQIMSDNPKERVVGFNRVYHSAMQKGVGQPGRFPNTVILRKDIENVVPDPNSSQDDPRVIPTLRVWVKGAKPYNGPPIEGAPEGATGYYLAPMTEGRSSDPQADPNVKSISIKQALARVDTLMELGEAMNQAEGQAAYTKYRALRDAKDGADLNTRFNNALAERGIKAPKSSTKLTSIGAGGLYKQNFNAENKETSTEVIARTRKGGAATLDEINEKIDELEVSDATKAQMKKAAVLYAATKAKGGGMPGLGSGEGGADGLSAAQDRKVNRQLGVLKEESESINEEKKRAREEYVAELPKMNPYASTQEIDADKATRAELKKAYDARMKNLDDAERTNVSNRAGLQRRLDMGDDAADGKKSGGLVPAAAKKGAPPPAGKLTKDAAAAKFGF